MMYYRLTKTQLRLTNHSSNIPMSNGTVLDLQDFKYLYYYFSQYRPRLCRNFITKSNLIYDSSCISYLLQSCWTSNALSRNKQLQHCTFSYLLCFCGGHRAIYQSNSSLINSKNNIPEHPISNKSIYQSIPSLVNSNVVSNTITDSHIGHRFHHST